MRIRTASTLLVIFLIPLAAIFRCRGGTGIETWTLRTPGVTNELDGVAYGTSNFVAVGTSGLILVSSNGADWSSAVSPTPNNLHAVTFINGVFYAVGGSSFCSSTNGLDWTKATLPVAGDTFAVAYGDGMFVAAGSGFIANSPNGINWINQNFPNNFRFATYSRGKFIVTGQSVVMFSPNGSDWVRPVLTPGSIRTAIPNNRAFVLAGGDEPSAPGGVLKISQDGTNWFSPQPTVSDNFYAGAAGGGIYVGAGGQSEISSPRRMIATSIDLTNWVEHISDLNPPLYGIAYGNGSFVAVGDRGEIVQSGPVFSLSMSNRVGGGNAWLTLTGEAGRVFQLEFSTNIVATIWQPMCAVTNTTGTTVFSDTNAATGPRCYRAVTE